MSELIDSFDRLKAEELHKTQAAQKEIVRLLQTLARKLEHMENPARLNADRFAAKPVEWLQVPTSRRYAVGPILIT